MTRVFILIILAIFGFASCTLSLRVAARGLSDVDDSDVAQQSTTAVICVPLSLTDRAKQRFHWRSRCLISRRNYHLRVLANMIFCNMIAPRKSQEHRHCSLQKKIWDDEMDPGYLGDVESERERWRY